MEPGFFYSFWENLLGGLVSLWSSEPYLPGFWLTFVGPVFAHLAVGAGLAPGLPQALLSAWQLAASHHVIINLGGKQGFL